MKRWLWLLLLILPAGPPCLAAESRVGGRTSPDGKEELMVDLPGSEHLKNAAGKDGSGLCVFTSLEHSGRWQNVEALRGFQQKMRKEAGGGWPQKVDAMLKKYAAGVSYVQYTGSDPGLLKLTLRTGRMPSVTYGYSPRYGGRIAHMVNLAHLSDRWACVLDNNFPGENQYEWMAPEEFYRRWKMGGSGWAVVLLNPPPPPIPVNVQATPDPFFCGQCSGGSCGPVRIVPTPAMYRWRWEAGTPQYLYLCRGDAQVGAYKIEEGVYLPYDAATGVWGQATEPPIALPAWVSARVRCRCCPACDCGRNCRCPELGRRCSPCCSCARGEDEERVISDFGVERSRFPVLPDGETYYALNGRRVDAGAALRAIQASGDGLTDDTARLRLTVIGSAEECQRVTDDLARHAALAGWRDRLLVQSYRPDAWAVQGVNLPAGGHPAIVLQTAPDAQGRGRVLHVQYDYADGAEGLAGALRKADPNYDPHHDPDRRKPPQPEPSPAGPEGYSLWVTLGVLGGLLVVMLLGRRMS
jgi:hypothetical protein